MKQINLRIPDDLHEKMKATAGRDRRSINSWIIVLIERAVTAEQDRPASPPP